uniref:Polyprotein allergen nematode domain-containing protein n=1 Tax=Parascaris univalens TaxID=6257 RepID=A0A915CAU9_PARUN
TFIDMWRFVGSLICTALITFASNVSSLALTDSLSWRQKSLLSFHNCALWMLNNTAISDDERNEVELLLINENITAYRKAVLAYAELEPNASLVINETISCFNKLANIGHKLERLNRARHKFVLRPLVHRPFAHKTYDRRHYDIEKVLSHWQVRKLHSYLAKTGDSESIIKAFRHHFGQFPMTTQSHLIDEFFHYSPSLRRSGHQRRETQRQTSKSKRSSTSNNLDRHQKSLSVITEIEHEHKMLLEKANAYLQRLDGRTRRQKTEQVIALCARLADRIFGDEKTLGFRGKHQVGATDIDIERRLGEAISKLEKKYKQANDQVASTCRLVFGFRNRFSREINNAFLNETYLYWLNVNETDEIERMRDTGASEPELLVKLSDFYSRLNSTMQRNVSAELMPFCNEYVKRVVGEEGFKELRSVHEESMSIEQLTKKYTELIDALSSEQQRVNAERVGLFCKKIYRLTKFDSTYLTTWLTAEEKRELQYMIQDPDINDQAVYDRLLEFYKSTEGEKRNDAKEIIESGCKWFISHMLGEDIADRIEDQRQSGNFSAQMLSATLAKHVSEIENEKQRIKTQKTLRICERIYLGYAGDCFCNGHSSICDSLTHFCVGCEDNTDGIECENCAAGYVGSGLLGAEGCFEMNYNNSSTICNCQGDSSHCDESGHCLPLSDIINNHQRSISTDM